MSDYATLIRPTRYFIYFVAAPSHGALEVGFAGLVLQPQMKPYGRIQVFNVAIG